VATEMLISLIQGESPESDLYKMSTQLIQRFLPGRRGQRLSGSESRLTEGDQRTDA